MKRAIGFFVSIFLAIIATHSHASETTKPCPEGTNNNGYSQTIHNLVTHAQSRAEEIECELQEAIDTSTALMEEVTEKERLWFEASQQYLSSSILNPLRLYYLLKEQSAKYALEQAKVKFSENRKRENELWKEKALSMETLSLFERALH